MWFIKQRDYQNWDISALERAGVANKEGSTSEIVMAETKAEEGSLATNLSSLFKSGNSADVTLVVGDSELPGHSLILAARSPVFAAMFQHDMRESHSHRVEISDVQEAVLKQLLLFMYSDTAPQLESMAAELLAASDKYDLPLLKKMCEEQLGKAISVENAAAIALNAELHSCLTLKSVAVDFIAEHPNVMTTQGWINVMQNNVDAAVKICRQVAGKSSSASSSSSKHRILSESEKPKLSLSLIDAAKSGCKEEVKQLLAAGAAPNSRDDSGLTALHHAVREGSVATVQCLLAAGADANARDSSRQTPLHEAAARGRTGIIWMLFAASADLDAQDRWGKTPLHWATSGKKKSSEAALYAAGAEELLDDSGRYP